MANKESKSKLINLSMCNQLMAFNPHQYRIEYKKLVVHQAKDLRNIHGGNTGGLKPMQVTKSEWSV